jgi:hypothetical protein
LWDARALWRKPALSGVAALREANQGIPFEITVRATGAYGVDWVYARAQQRALCSSLSHEAHDGALSV